ncbi:MAG: polysaccharide pyruvyl transferase family protein, partial [Coleofasciculus sp. S288]|nr:polysaccharide pyruvyl transferase family protein [Coleofasciculus sp. S288]
KLHYYKSSRGNFGDDLNVWLWSKLIPELVEVAPSDVKVQSSDTLFVGIGTLLNHHVPREPFKVVFGAGVGYGDLPIIDERWKFYCVRGPLSARALGLPPSVAITDAAALLRTVNLPSRPKLYSASFMPHHTANQSANWKVVCQLAGLHYIDPTQSVEDVLFEIQSSRVILAEAMHGAIVADALRVPWIPVQVTKTVNEFKWHDWCQSLNLEYKPVVIFPRIGIPGTGWSSFIKRMALIPFIGPRLGWVAKYVQPILSSDCVIEEATARLQEQLEKLEAGKLSCI